MNTTMKQAPTEGLLLCLFLGSGAAALIYEIAWTRQFGLLFGHTAMAASIVLFAFFAGMTLGAVLARRIMERVGGLRAYGIAEVLAAVWVCVMAWLVSSTSVSSAWLNHSVPALQVLFRVIYCVVLMAPATISLGATLPFMAHACRSAGVVEGSRWLAKIYGANTAGAVAGILIATLVLIPRLGVASTQYAAAALAALCGVVAIIYGAGTTNRASAGAPRSSVGVAGLGRRRLMALGGACGFVMLAFQVLVTRMFAIVLSNSVYCFAIVLAAFLLLLSLGAWLASRFAERMTSGFVLVAQVIAGASAIVMAPILFVLVTRLEPVAMEASFGGNFAAIFGLAMLALLAPVTLIGMLFPWLLGQAARSSDGQDVGPLTAVNTAGAACGALAASFVLLPSVGLWTSFAVLACLFLLFGAVLVPGQKSLRHPVTLLVYACIFFAASRGLQTFNGIPVDRTRIFHSESAYGWIDVVRNDGTGSLRLQQNVQYWLGTTSASVMARRQAHIPLLLHAEPKSTLFIGLATGISAGAALDHPEVEEVDVVELIPDVVEAASYFAPWNRDILTSPKAKITVNDGRHYLESTNASYDVIVSDLFVPWHSHTGYLYTTETYAAALARLKKGGVFAQWLPLWQLSEAEFSTIAHTFASVFPHTSVWFAHMHPFWNDVALIGSNEPLALDRAMVERRISGGQLDLEDLSDFLSRYAGDWRYDPATSLNTSDRPIVEFSTALSTWQARKRLIEDQVEPFYRNVVATLPMAGLGLSQEEEAGVRERQLRYLRQGEPMAPP